MTGHIFVGRPPGSIRALLKKIEILDNGCWILPFATEWNGYCRVRIKGKRVLVHRLFWEYWHGPIPEGYVLDHKCRIRNCMNDSHLEVMTYSKNNKRGAKYWGKVYYGE